MEIRSQALVCDLQTNQLQAAVNDPSKGSQLVILLQFSLSLDRKRAFVHQDLSSWLKPNKLFVSLRFYEGKSN